MRFYPEELKQEARSIASSGKGARLVWAELRQWASKRGPAAMKSAVMEFLGEYGGSPEAACVMPELLRSSSHVFSSQERGELVSIAMHGKPFSAVRGPQRVAMARQSLPMESNRPALSISFRPSERGTRPIIGAIEPLSPKADHAYLRDMPIRTRERLETAIIRPMALKDGAGRNVRAPHPAGFDPQKSPDAVIMGAHKGERLVRSLIHSVRSHGRDEHMHLAPPSLSAGPTRKKARKTKKPGKGAGKKRKAASVRKTPRARSRAGKLQKGRSRRRRK